MWNATSTGKGGPTEVRPRQLVHHGRIAAAAFLFNTDLLPLVEVRRRVLECWSPGIRVFRLPEGVLAVLPQPVLTRTDEARGLPLIARHLALLSAPLSPTEWTRLMEHPHFHASRETVVLMRDGVAVPFPLSELPTEDPVQYLQIDDPVAISVSSLGEPPSPPVMPEGPSFNSRVQLGGIAPPPSERESVLGALRSAGNRPATPSISETQKEDDTIRGILSRFFRNVFGRGEDGGVQSSTPEASKLDRLFENSHHLMSFRSLVDNIGKQQADYIRKTIELFENGKLDEALRHAIPLGKGDDSDDRPPFFGIPSPRETLDISPEDVASRSSFTFMPSLYDEMRRLYREAFDRLVRAGRIEEAAFVLAELLKENDEAVAFLERHGRLTLAAEMAEARRLAPGLVVRLWFLAGNLERAVRVARRMKAFHDAILRLERGDAAFKERASELRVIWARELAEAGDYAAAIDAALPVPAARVDILGWMDRVIAMGGVPAARMRVRRLALSPEATEDTLAAGLHLLADTSEATRNQREAFLETLSLQEFREGSPAKSAARTLARAGIRTAYRDLATAGPDQFYDGQLRDARSAHHLVARLQTLANDGPLRADAPPPASRKSPPVLEERSDLLVVEIAENDVGTLPLTDGVRLPDGRLLAALGEAGLRLVAPDGRTLLHWNQPTHRIVLADSGNRAITIAPRGDAVQRLGKLDIGRRTLTDWCDAPISAYAPDYDGALWFVQSGDTLVAVDVAQSDFAALWRMRDLGGQALSIARDPERLMVGLAYPYRKDTRGLPVPTRNQECVYLCLSLPELMVHSNESIEDCWQREGQPFRLGLQVAPGEAVTQQTLLRGSETGEPGLFLWNHMGQRSFGDVALARDPQGRPYALPLAVSDKRIVFAVPELSGMICSVLDSQVDVLAEIRLAWSETVSLHLQSAPSGSSEVVTIADNRGRILTMDLNTGTVLANVRVR